MTIKTPPTSPRPKPWTRIPEDEISARELAEAWAEVNAIAPGIPMEERLGVSVSQLQKAMDVWASRPMVRVVRE